MAKTEQAVVRDAERLLKEGYRAAQAKLQQGREHMQFLRNEDAGGTDMFYEEYADFATYDSLRNEIDEYFRPRQGMYKSEFTYDLACASSSDTLAGIASVDDRRATVEENYHTVVKPLFDAVDRQRQQIDAYRSHLVDLIDGIDDADQLWHVDPETLVEYRPDLDEFAPEQPADEPPANEPDWELDDVIYAQSTAHTYDD